MGVNRSPALTADLLCLGLPSGRLEAESQPAAHGAVRATLRQRMHPEQQSLPFVCPDITVPGSNRDKQASIARHLERFHWISATEIITVWWQPRLG